MYNVSTIKTDLSIIGWRQNSDPTGEQLTSMTTSTSGLYYQDEHPLLTLDNLYSIAPDFDQYEYPTFDDTKTDYQVGNIVVDSSIIYQSIKVDGVANSITNTEFWIVYSPFTEWLREKTEAGIIQAINDWYSKKSKFSTVQNLLSRETIFDCVGDFDDIQENTGKVVGQYIRPMNSKNVGLKIHELSLQMSQNQTVTVKLFKKGTKTPMVEESFVYDKDGGVQWFTPSEPDKWELFGGEMYFIGYDQDVIAGNAINALKDHDFRFGYFPTGKFYNVQSFLVESDFAEMWNESDVTYSTASNFGLNYKISVGCDYTEFIVQQKDLFKIAISKKVAMNLLRELVFNPNSLVNRNESNIDKKMLLYEIDGDSQSTEGNNRSIKEQYDNAIMDIQFDTTGIDKVCLPCRRKGPIYRSV